MKYVNIIRRIERINQALIAIPTTERYDDIANRLYDKRDELVKSLKEYIKCPDRTNRDLRKQSYNRRKQLQLACNLLRINYYHIIH